MFIKGSTGVGSHPKLHTYEEGYLLPVLSADELLFGHRHKGLLRLIRDLTPEISQADFDRSYGQLLKNFMEFVQVLPHKPNGIIGSMLNYALARATVAFQKFCQLPKTHTTPLLKFALFSAALLKELGRVMSNQRIVLTDEEGEYLQDWNPCSGSMVGQSQFYKMYPIAVSYLRIENEATPLLARQLIPRDIFLWLSSDVIVFADWLSALLNQESDEAKIITQSLSLIKREDIIDILNSLESAPVETHEPQATEMGEAFYQWLKEALTSGKIIPNAENSGLKIVSQGILIEQKIFKTFAEQLKAPFIVVYAQFGNLMGIVKKGGNDYLHAAYFSPSEATSHLTTFSGGAAKGKTVHEGMVINREMLALPANVNTTSLQSVKTMTSLQHQYPTATDNALRQKPTSTSK